MTKRLPITNTIKNKRTLPRKSFVVLGIFLFMIVGTAVFASSDKIQQTVQEKIDQILVGLRAATEQELARGTVADTTQGKVFVGESAVKMKAIHDAALKATDDLIARSASERIKAATAIQLFAEDDMAVEYKFTSKSSYNWDVPVEIYYAGTNQYEIDARNNTIIQFGPRPLTASDPQPKELTATLRYTKEQLELMAKKFIAKRVDVDIAKLVSVYGDKEGINYFFRFEDRSRKIEDMYPFIQVGFSREGELISYTNSLGL